MTLFAFLFSMSETGVPVLLVLVAMLCDTTILITLVLMGVIHG
jgi:hypothetical protein